MDRDFGSWKECLADWKATAMSARGWVLTAYNFRDGLVHNYLLDAHNQLVPVGVWPLLVLDVYEHAYAIDFGVKRPPYIDVFMKNIRWDAVNKRLERVSKLG